MSKKALIGLHSTFTQILFPNRHAIIESDHLDLGWCCLPLREKMLQFWWRWHSLLICLLSLLKQSLRYENNSQNRSSFDRVFQTVILLLRQICHCWSTACWCYQVRASLSIICLVGLTAISALRPQPLNCKWQSGKRKYQEVRDW